MPSIDEDHHVESPFLTPKPKVMVGISGQGGLCCDHHVESPFLTPKPKVLVGTVNSEIIAMFLLMQKMRQDVCRISKYSHIYFSL